jgi:hypothetical protein
MGDFAFKPNTIVRRPRTITPWSGNTEEMTWVHMKAKKITDQTTSGRGGSIAGGADGAEFVFIAPDTITENIGHDWAEYDSIQSRVANKIRDMAKLGAELKTVIGTVGNISKLSADTFKKSSGNVGTKADQLIRSAYNNIAAQSIPKIKVDTPLYYSGSRRRQITLDFTLIAESIDTIKSDVVDVVHDLMKYSAASSRGAVDIEFPYYFELFTQPAKILNYTTAALMAVQPVWTGPWIKGIPLTCKLNLTFKDISPLYRQTISSGSIINVISGSKTNEKKSKDQKPIFLHRRDGKH